MPSLATLALYLLAGTAIGLLALLSGIPAAPLAEALGAGETVILNAGLTDPAGNAAGTLAIAPAN